MKVYQVTMRYYDGGHDHGQYESPVFFNREDAERFAQAIRDLPDNDSRKWWTDDGMSDSCEPYVSELDVCESWDGELGQAKAYLLLTFN